MQNIGIACHAEHAPIFKEKFTRARITFTIFPPNPKIIGHQVWTCKVECRGQKEFNEVQDIIKQVSADHKIIQ
jgi:hypothetical protein